MARKVFISFLGANKYKPYDKVIYQIDNNNFETRYAPEATLNLICNDFQDSDRIYFFLTDDAKKYAWDDYTYNIKGETIENTGLHNKIKDNFGSFIKEEPIKDGKSELEIWEIFTKIYDALNIGDEVIFDVTLGFRTSPILTITLINYAKALKKIKVKGLYYGAYEARENNITPIWNLISFSKLQEWSVATNDFVDYGRTEKLINVVGDDYTNLKNALKNISDSIETNRGRRIMEGKIFNDLEVALNNIKKIYPPPLSNVIDEIKKSTNQFSTTENWKNGLTAVQWCIDNKMVQQGITILDELVITYLCIKYYAKKKYYQKSYRRGVISACLFVKIKGTPEEEWKENLKNDAEIAKDIINSISDELAQLVSQLSSLRNDINHSGYSKNQEPDEFKDGLSKIFNDLKPLLE
jgi:CRISPR-associated Csx2 family protein